MTDKTTILRAFNTHLFEFLDDIISVFPDNVDIVASKTSLEFTKKANPTLIVKIWYSYIYLPYAEIIDAGNLDFFINKDYSGDLSGLSNSRDISAAVDALRDPIRSMSESNKAHSLNYIQNLCKLSKVYNSMGNPGFP
jgi:hypothetical protein